MEAGGQSEKNAKAMRTAAELSSRLSRLMKRRALRARAFRAFAGRPNLLAGMLAMHVGEISTTKFLTNGLALGWRMLTL